ncbi:MAG: HAD-IA family hydrolase [Candidatus Saccharimonadales bacterium]
MIKAIIFDCFGVLYVRHGPEYVKNHAKNYERIKGDVLDLHNQVDYGLISTTEFEQQLAELTGLTQGEINRHYTRGFGRNNELMDYIESVLRPHYNIGMLSNIGRGTMEEFFTKKEREHLFDSAVLSSETGMIKPNPAAYVHMCETLGVDTSEAIMIDDNADNVRGAEIAGLVAIRYDGFAHLKRRLEKLLPKT